MKLTEDQARIVSENHNLIYWYINLKGLNLDEWYGFVATELCKAVVNHDESKASLITYFKIRTDSKLKNQWRDDQHRRLEQSLGLRVLFNEENVTEGVEDEYFVDEVLDRVSDIDEVEKEIINLLAKGYTQSEVGDMLGVSQWYVSTRLKKVRDNIC